MEFTDDEIEWMNISLDLKNKRDWVRLTEHALAWTKAMPQSAIAWHNLGDTYGISNQITSQITSYKQALCIEPACFDTWFNLSNAYKQLGYHEDSKKAFKYAGYATVIMFSLNDSVSWYNLGTTYKESRRYENAIKAFNNSVRYNPQSTDAWHNLGMLCFESGQFKEAINAFKGELRAHRKWNEDWKDTEEDYEILMRLADAYVKNSQYKEAIKMYHKIIDQYGYNEIHIKIGDTHVKAGQNYDAIEAYEKSAPNINTDPETCIKIGDLYVESGFANKVLYYYQFAMKEMSRSNDSMFIDESWKKFERWKNMGTTLAKFGKYASALIAYNQAIRLNPKDLEIWNEISIAYAKSGQPEKAIHSLKQLTCSDLADEEYWTTLADNYLKCGMIFDAIEAYNEAVCVNPENARLWNLLGCLYAKRGMIDNAIGAYEEAVHLNPTDLKAWNKLKITENTSISAIKIYQWALRKNPKDSDILYLFADELFNCGYFEEAIRSYQQVVKIKPKNVTAWKKLGEAHRKIKQYEEAIHAYLKSLSNDGNNSEALYGIGIAYANCGQVSNVMSVFNKLKDLDQDKADRFFKEAILPQK